MGLTWTVGVKCHAPRSHSAQWSHDALSPMTYRRDCADLHSCCIIATYSDRNRTEGVRTWRGGGEAGGGGVSRGGEAGAGGTGGSGGP